MDTIALKTNINKKDDKKQILLFKEGKLKELNLSVLCYKEGEYYTFGSECLGVFGYGCDEIEAKKTFEVMIEEIFEVNINDVKLNLTY